MSLPASKPYRNKIKSRKSLSKYHGINEFFSIEFKTENVEESNISASNTLLKPKLFKAFVEKD